MKKNQKSKKYFGTDGIRGKTNQSLINEKFLSELYEVSRILVLIQLSKAS